MPYIVVYDANALFGNTQRDLLLRIGQQRHLVQAKWTQQILDEMTRAIRERYPNITEEKAARLEGRINDSVADCLVTGYEPLIPALELPDPDDRHVLAAAIRCGAQLIVTSDKDFPPESLALWGVKAKHPDDFVLDQISIDSGAVQTCVQQIVDSRHRRPVTFDEVLQELVNAGLPRSIAALRAA